MIKMLKYHGYEDDGVEGYQCLNCHNHISMRHHAFSITLDYCPFCGCKFEAVLSKTTNTNFTGKVKLGIFVPNYIKCQNGITDGRLKNLVRHIWIIKIYMMLFGTKSGNMFILIILIMILQNPAVKIFYFKCDKI